MNQHFKIKTIALSIAMVFPVAVSMLHAAEPYPANPPALSTSVQPNVMLFIDNSGSMLQDGNNNWITQSGNSSCNESDEIWTGCISNSSYRNFIDSATTNPNTKMNIAKRVARNLVSENPNLRWGVASFRIDNTSTIGGNERVEGAKIVTPIGSSIGTSTDNNTSTIMGGINSLVGRTSTPLGEALLEITQYYQGKPSKYGVITGNYTSPIQYRCQKNFAIVITDGDANDDNNLPGVGSGSANSSISYTTYNSSNQAVSNSFSICTATNNPVCPATLEGGSGTPGFGDSKNRFRALRDVARYANLMDMRTSGNDLDGKSFNDPKFISQTMQTYTVGFNVTNDTLRAAAIVGGGTYNTASSEAQLAASLNAAVSSISGSISNAGGVAVQSEITVADNWVFQPVFNPNGWYGELRRYELDASGNINLASKLDANAVLNSRTATRRIFTSKSTGTTSNTTTKFDFTTANIGTMTSTQQTNLGANSTERQKVVNFLRNDPGYSSDSTGSYVYRVRSNKLGDIIDGQPVVVGKPAGVTPDSTYETYKSSQANRKMVFIGANDGMFHGFTSQDMSETFGYIPQAVYPRLKALTSVQYGQATPHTHHVNGAARQLDVKFDDAWNTIIAGGLGQGGQGYFAINATNMPTNTSPATAANTIMWEYNEHNDKAMGYSFSNPIIYNVRNGSSSVLPVVMFSNGYNNDYDDTAEGGQRAHTTTTGETMNNSSAFYIVNARNGNLVKKITLPSGSKGLSSPAGIDMDLDGVVEYVYAGDENGNLWRFDLTATDPANFSVNTTPIYTATTSVNGQSKGQPIIMRPAIEKIEGEDGLIGNLVLFGTGRLLTDSDRTNQEQQTFYAVLDKLESNPQTVSKSELQQQTVTSTFTESSTSRRAGAYRKVSRNGINTTTGKPTEAFDLKNTSATKKGWYIDFPSNSEKMVTSPILLEDKVIFGTGITASTEMCLPYGKGWIMGLNPLTGSVVQDNRFKEFSFIDINKNGKTDAGDKQSFNDGSSYISGYEMSGIPTEATFVQQATRLTAATGVATSYSSAGAVIALREANSMAVYGKKGPRSRQTSSGKGQLITGTIGSDKLESEKILGPVYGVKVETSTWRELK
jgi:type IV pilus assembly protein PilY1